MIDVDIEASEAADEEEHIATTAALAFTIPQSEMDSFVARKQPLFSERDVWDLLVAFRSILALSSGNYKSGSEGLISCESIWSKFDNLPHRVRL